MALKATRLIWEAEAQPATAAGIHRRKELLIQARDWARAHRQPRLCATAAHKLAAAAVMHPAPKVDL
jgi:protein involved in temperature-dependent protein secretion